MSPKPIYAFDLFINGTTERIDQIDAAVPDDVAFRWIHFDLADQGVENWIASKTDAAVARALARADTRPGVKPFPDGQIIILRGVNLNPESDPEDMVSIRLWVTERLIISTRLRRLMAVVALREQIEAGDVPASPGVFVSRLANGMTERMDPIIAELADEIDALEEESVDRSVGLRTQLAEIRRSTIALRRHIAPQRDALVKLATDTTGLFEPSVLLHFRETADQVTRLVEDLDAVRERSAILNDQLVDRRAEEMNTNMMVLSVVAAIFLPLGFLTGLLGINVGGMPGTDFDGAFYIVCGLCLLVGGALTWWFKAKNWF